MLISSAQSRALQKLMLALTEPYAEAEVRRRVGEHILDLLEADHYASYVWDEELRCFGSRVALNMSEKNLDTYDAYYQFRDPITQLLSRMHAPSLVEQVMPQSALIRTEFFNDFLARDGLYWGVNVYAWDGNQNIGDMRIWRSKNRERFDPNALQLLKMVEPSFTAALQRCRRTAAIQPPRAPQVVGGQPLSRRESAIVQLVSLGLSDKAIALKLGISFTTVRTHMGRAFRKLNVTNRVQLVGRLMNRPHLPDA